MVFSGEAALCNCSTWYCDARQVGTMMSDNKLDGDIRLFVPERYKEAQPCKEGRDGADQTRLGLESFSWIQKRFAVDSSSGSSFGHVAKSKKELSEAKIHFNEAQNKGSRTRKVERGLRYEFDK